MPIYKGEPVPVPRDLLAQLLENGTFNGDLSRDEDAERVADYIIAVSEAEQILQNNSKEGE